MKVLYTTWLFTILSVALSSAIPAQHIHRLQSRVVDVKAEWPKAWCKGGKFAQAILGSPYGLGVGYFLAQHKYKLGNKSVEKITVFRPNKGIMPYLLFWIEDVPFATRSLPTSNMRRPRARF
ncbi:hypothetical protein E8E11_011235 [Didymella keratinophila]|nr:hypothetical protein E8E11_011235 [Didymella keratinophila]